MKILTIVGSRPQIIKSAWLTYSINKYYKKKIQEVIIDTGQHYDKNLVNLFEENSLSYKPKYIFNFNKKNFSLKKNIKKISEIIKRESPKIVIVIGDTKSTIVGALSAKKNGIRLAHIEAGLRSGNFEMPEESIRIITDHLSDELYCPDKFSKQNLIEEGIESKIVISGDILNDVFKFVENKTAYLKKNNKNKNIYFTCHRHELLKNKKKLLKILKHVKNISKYFNIFFPIHPNTKKKIYEYRLGAFLKNVNIIKPIEYKKSIELLKKSRLLITDSGGLQRESYLLGIPCLVIRDETEWKGLGNLFIIGDKDPMPKINYIYKNNIFYKNRINLLENSSKLILKNILKNYGNA